MQKPGGEYCQSQRAGEGRLSNLSLGPTGRLGARLSEPAAVPAGTYTVNCCLPDPVWPNRPQPSLCCAPPSSPPPLPHELLRSLHTRQHVKLLCFWKHTHTHTRREALKFFLEQVQRFIYEFPRGWVRQKSGLCRLSAVLSSHQHNHQLKCAPTECPLRDWTRLGGAFSGGWCMQDAQYSRQQGCPPPPPCPHQRRKQSWC